MSTRRGEFITIDDLLDDLTTESIPGKDALRFTLLTRSPDSSMNFDMDLVVKQSRDNPVYYLQYGYARIQSILRKAVEAGYTPDVFAGGDLSLLTHPAELALIRQMVSLPEVVVNATEQLAPHQLSYYALELATQFHAFYDHDDCRVISSDPAEREISRARLRLCDGARIVLTRVLGLMGVTMPDRM